MPHALIVAHGQPSAPGPAEETLAAYASEVDQLCDGVTVRSSTLAAEGMLEERLANLSDDTVIYPLFMAKGWFVTKALPKRLGDRQIRILDPLGVDPKLPSLVAEALREKFKANRWETTGTDLVIAAHGSGRSRNPSAVTRAFAEKLEQQIAFRSLSVGFVEEPPSIAEAAAGLSRQSLCLPFFACSGGHVIDDVPEALDAAGFKGQVTPVVGELPQIKHHIAETLAIAFSNA